MHQFNPADIVWRTFAIVFLIGALLCIVLALILIFKPHLMERINRVANHWISMRHISHWADHSISLEDWLYRHHRVPGLLLTLGAGYMLFYIGWLFNKTATLRVLSAYVPNKLLATGLLEVFVVLSLTGGALALCVGLLFWLRPNLLRGIENDLNQWLSSRQATKAADLMHHHVDRFVVRHAQPVGWLLLAGSGYLSFMMWRSLA